MSKKYTLIPVDSFSKICELINTNEKDRNFLLSLKVHNNTSKHWVNHKKTPRNAKALNYLDFINILAIKKPPKI